MLDRLCLAKSGFLVSAVGVGLVLEADPPVCSSSDGLPSLPVVLLLRHVLLLQAYSSRSLLLVEY